jgi:hypothetical protein
LGGRGAGNRNLRTTALQSYQESDEIKATFQVRC